MIKFHWHHLHHLKEGLFLLALISLIFFLGTEEFISLEYFHQVISTYGVYGPLVLILLQFIGVVAIIFPHYLISVTGGFLFGPLWGTVYSVMGVMLASGVIFGLSRKKVKIKRFLVSFVGKKEFKHFDVLFKKHKSAVLLFSRLIPIFPEEIISVAAASATKIKIKDYLILTLFGMLPMMFLLNLFGYKLAGGKFTFTLIVLFAGMILFALIYTFRNYIKACIFKEVQLVEKELEKEQKKLKKEMKII